jgi:ectoine hydroxylase-related dioxygenase (phytanoyl-CoA dioxygenase family)
MNRPGNDLIPLRWNDGIVARILGLRQRMRLLRDLLRANDLKWLSGYVSIKAAHSPALWWHQDWWCWDHPISFRRAPTQVAVLCYLTDTNETNGALRVLPGSHHKSMPMHGQLPEPHGECANGLPLHHPAMRDCPDQMTVSVRAGDAVVLDYRLLHGTHANGTPQRRDCILLSFIPNWRALPSELKAHFAMHPALPQDGEASSRLASGYADLLPSFAGTPKSLAVNRVAPAIFGAR